MSLSAGGSSLLVIISFCTKLFLFQSLTCCLNLFQYFPLPLNVFPCLSPSVSISSSFVEAAVSFDESFDESFEESFEFEDHTSFETNLPSLYVQSYLIRWNMNVRVPLPWRLSFSNSPSNTHSSELA